VQYFNKEELIIPATQENSEKQNKIAPQIDKPQNPSEPEGIHEKLAIEEVVNIDMDSIKKPGFKPQSFTPIEPVDERLTQPSPIFNWLTGLLLGIVSLMAMGLYQAWQTVAHAWLTSPIIGGSLGLLVVAFASVLSVLIWREVQGYRRINRIDLQLNHLKKLDDTSERQAWLDFYQQNQQLQTSQHAQAFHYSFFQKVKPHHTPQELNKLYHYHVLEPLKSAARTVIKKDMMASAAISGLSPNAFFQTIALVWLHLKMVRQVAQIYGFRPGFIGQVKLLKMAFNSMVILSLTDVATEMLMSDLLGPGVLSKVSAQSAEAVVSARLTCRLGEGIIEALTLK
jgi:putative membrane protein